MTGQQRRHGGSQMRPRPPPPASTAPRAEPSGRSRTPARERAGSTCRSSQACVGAALRRSDTTTAKIRVVVRKRPLTRREVEAKQVDILEVREPSSVAILEPKVRVDLTKYVDEHIFTFDDAFDEGTTNERMYAGCCSPLVEAAVEHGVHATCFAYGCTGSGKTYTMMGEGGQGVRGLYALAAQDLFARISQPGRRPIGVFVSFYEIYFGKLFDLLNERTLVHARENAKQKVIIMGLTEQRVESADNLLDMVNQGLQVRKTGSTSANSDSSRSHAILQISLKDIAVAGQSPRVLSKLSFVDLAGAERADQNLGANRQARMDGAEINKSLLALKECIRAMDQEKEHTPFRGSKLTQVLKDSFVGDCRTVMIANLSPASGQSEHCLNTLRYADRVKELRAKATTEGDQVLRALGAKDDAPRGEELQRRHSDVGRKFAPAQRTLTRAAAAPERPAWVGVLDSPDRDRQEDAEGVPWPPLSSPPREAPPEVDPSRSSFESLEPRRSSIDSLAESFEPFPADPASFPADPASRDIDWEDATLPDLAREHDKLIGQILAEEEELIASHRGHVDSMVELMKQEYDLVNDVDQPGSTVDDYVDGLERVLAVQLASLEELNRRANAFANHLAEEDQISRKFNSRLPPGGQLDDSIALEA